MLSLSAIAACVAAALNLAPLATLPPIYIEPHRMFDARLDQLNLPRSKDGLAYRAGMIVLRETVPGAIREGEVLAEELAHLTRFQDEQPDWWIDDERTQRVRRECG